MMKQSTLGGSSDLNDVVEAATLKAVFVKLLKGGHEDLTPGGFRGFDGGRCGHNDCDDTDQSVCCQADFLAKIRGADTKELRQFFAQERQPVCKLPDAII